MAQALYLGYFQCSVDKTSLRYWKMYKITVLNEIKQVGRKLIRKTNTPNKPRSFKFYQKSSLQNMAIQLISKNAIRKSTNISDLSSFFGSILFVLIISNTYSPNQKLQYLKNNLDLNFVSLSLKYILNGLQWK